MSKASAFSLLAILTAGGAWAQQVPIYRVTVSERTVQAVNYKYRQDPTRIDFRGTVLLPEAKGQAMVQSRRGRTEMTAEFERVVPPTRFGREYLTYVLWAITPEGYPMNLGEVLANGRDRARLKVTTDLQAFGLIVTAEPYATVRQPSDVVVMENQVRPDTQGKIEAVSAKYELLPRGHYTYVRPSNEEAAAGGGKVPMKEYESIVELYQAQNAVQIARAHGAAELAPDTMARAENLLRQAQEMQSHRGDHSTIVMTARQAAQTAEDARAITIKRKEDREMASAHRTAQEADAKRVAAEQAVRQAQIQASADRAMLADELRAAKAAQVTQQPVQPLTPTQPPAPVVINKPVDREEAARRSELRMQVFEQLSRNFAAADTPRGLVVTLPDSGFRGSMLDGPTAARLSGVASIVAAHPGLTVEVDGHFDAAGAQGERFSYERATAVRDTLMRAGVTQVTARGLGNSRPMMSNASPGGRMQNRRVEIVITGEPIGSLPYWDRTYSLRK